MPGQYLNAEAAAAAATTAAHFGGTPPTYPHANHPDINWGAQVLSEEYDGHAPKRSSVKRKPKTQDNISLASSSVANTGDVETVYSSSSIEESNGATVYESDDVTTVGAKSVNTRGSFSSITGKNKKKGMPKCP